MRSVAGLRLVTMVALFIGFSLVGAGHAAASDELSITVHSMECYSGVGSAIFEECHDEFDSGTFAFDNGDGTATLIIDESTLTGYLGAYVYCRDLTDDEVLSDGSYADGVTFPIEADDEIVCDVYFIKPAPAGGSSTDTDNEVTNTTTLPSTGAGLPDSSTLPLLMMAAMLAGLAAFGTVSRRSHR